VRKVEIVALLDAFHNVAGDIPNFTLRQGRLCLFVPMLEITPQIVVAEFHEYAISIISRIELIPPVIHPDDERRVGHANR
jgi:hypothetical protein